MTCKGTWAPSELGAQLRGSDSCPQLRRGQLGSQRCIPSDGAGICCTPAACCAQPWLAPSTAAGPAAPPQAGSRSRCWGRSRGPHLSGRDRGHIGEGSGSSVGQRQPFSLSWSAAGNPHHCTPAHSLCRRRRRPNASWVATGGTTAQHASKPGACSAAAAAASAHLCTHGRGGLGRESPQPRWLLQNSSRCPWLLLLLLLLVAEPGEPAAGGEAGSASKDCGATAWCQENRLLMLRSKD